MSTVKIFLFFSFFITLFFLSFMPGKNRRNPVFLLISGVFWLMALCKSLYGGMESKMYIYFVVKYKFCCLSSPSAVKYAVFFWIYAGLSPDLFSENRAAHLCFYRVWRESSGAAAIRNSFYAVSPLSEPLPLCCRPAVCLFLTSPFRFLSRRHSAFSLHGSLFALPCNVAILSFSCAAVSLLPLRLRFSAVSLRHRFWGFWQEELFRDRESYMIRGSRQRKRLKMRSVDGWNAFWWQGV